MSRTTPRPADLGLTLTVRAVQDADKVRVTTTHGGMSFTASMSPVQARELAVQLVAASARADKRSAADAPTPTTESGRA